MCVSYCLVFLVSDVVLVECVDVSDAYDCCLFVWFVVVVVECMCSVG